MTRINVIPVEELSREHLVAECREIVRVFGLARDCQNSLHKKKIPTEFVLGTGHVTFFYPRLGYISKRYDRLCEEMIKCGYACNRVPKEELHQDIRAGLFQDYTPTQTAIALNRERIAQNNVKSELKKLGLRILRWTAPDSAGRWLDFAVRTGWLHSCNRQDSSHILRETPEKELNMAAVLERTAPPQATAFVRDAVARMQAAPRFFNQEEWNALASYEGPVVSGDPEGRIPENLEADDNE